MTIGFQNAALWPLATLVAVPLLLHLFARSRPPRYRFSSNQMIRRALRDTTRIKKPREWLLLLLRTLLVAALVLLFLRPVIRSAPIKQLTGAGRHVVAVIDRTASMAYADGARTRFSEACTQAAAVFAGLRGDDTANIVWIQARPQPELPTMAINIPALTQPLRQSEASMQAGDPGAAIALAAELLEGTQGYREICVISDFQATTWSQPIPALPSDITLNHVAVGQPRSENAAISHITTQPALPLAGEPTHTRGILWASEQLGKFATPWGSSIAGRSTFHSGNWPLAAGVAQTSLSIPNTPELAGTLLHFQGATRNQNSGRLR